MVWAEETQFSSAVRIPVVFGSMVSLDRELAVEFVHTWRGKKKRFVNRVLCLTQNTKVHRFTFDLHDLKITVTKKLAL